MENAAAQSQSYDSSTITFTAQRLDHLLKLIPANAVQQLKGAESDEELDHSFSGMVTCYMSLPIQKLGQLIPEQMII